MLRAQDARAASLAGPAVALGALTGVVDRPGGTPLSGVCVDATGPSGSVLALSRPGGRYVLTGLKPGRYLLRYRACAAPGRYLTQWIGGTGLPGWAGPGNSSTGRITGTVDGEGRPVRGICVLAYPVGGGAVRRAETSSRGGYTIRGLAPGRYLLQFAGSGAGCRDTGNWLPQWYRGFTTPYQPTLATKIRVSAGHAVRGIDASLRPGGELSGTVTSRSGRKLAGICVNVDSSSGPGSYDAFYLTRSRRSGRYVLHGVFPGRYQVQFTTGCGNSGNYAPQWWPHSATMHHAQWIRISPDRVAAHANAALGVGAAISGVVRFRNAAGKRLRGICVVLQQDFGDIGISFIRTATARNGSYRIDGLGSGRYTLVFTTSCGNNGNYLDAQHSVTLRVGHTRTGFDVYLKPGAGISGVVTDSHGRPAAGVCVQIQDSRGDFGGTQTNKDGSYSIGGMSTGVYTVQFTGGCGNRPSYVPQYYVGATQSDQAKPVKLTVGQVTAGIDATMQPGGTITGILTDASGHGLSKVCVGTVAPEQTLEGFYSDIEFTGRSGGYQVRNLVPGLYMVNFGCESGPLASQWFRSTTTAGTSDLVSVNPGVVTPGISAVMRTGGTIAGRVTNRSGHGLYAICVNVVPVGSQFPVAYNASEPITNNRGWYKIGRLAPGRYDVQFVDCDDFQYGSQWNADRATQAAATPVRVKSGRTSKINATLAAGGVISGRVLSNSGQPVSVCISTFGAQTDSYGFGFSGKNGYYAMTGLASGEYALTFYGCGSPEPNVGSVTRPGLVRVVAPHATKRINVDLPASGSISGTVLGGSPVAGPQSDVCAEVVPANPDGSSEFTMTRPDGTYSATHLAPGKYQVYIGDPYCPDANADLAPQWYDKQASQATANTVTVLAGHTTSGVGVTLLPYGGISGVVTGPSKAPIGGECVTAVPVDSVSSLLLGTDPQPEIALTSGNGRYALMSMLPGRYKVEFSSGCGASDLATQWWDGASSAKTATILAVTANVVSTGIDAALRR
jgi:hypothetical protein